jgi:hypothetical protein
MSARRRGAFGAFSVIAVLGGCAEQRANVPFDPFDPQLAAKSVEVFRQREDSIRDCMEQMGFEYSVQAPPSLGFTPDIKVASAEEADRSGYGFADSFIAGLEEDTEHIDGGPHDSGSRDIYLDSLDGEGGCRDQAAAAYPQVYDLSDAEVAALKDAWQWAESSDEYVDALATWRACMAAEGFEVVSPTEVSAPSMALFDQLVASVEYGAGNAGPSFDQALLSELRSAERAAAVAEARCSPALISVRMEMYKARLSQA